MDQWTNDLPYEWTNGPNDLERRPAGELQANQRARLGQIHGGVHPRHVPGEQGEDRPHSLVRTVLARVMTWRS